MLSAFTPLSLLGASSVFTVAGLPLHPLIVHAAVVLVPASAALFALLVFRPGLRVTYGRPVLVLLWAAAAASVAAVLAGEQLASTEGVSELHETSGKLVAIGSLLLAVVAYFWNAAFKSSLLQESGQPGNRLARLWGAAGVLLSAAAVVVVVVAGHSGAVSVWGSESASSSQEIDEDLSPAASTTPTEQPSTEPTATESPEPTPSSTQKSYTAAEVAKHNTASDCWTMIAKQAFDLTDWVNRHPGGSQVITALCGIDGDQAFVNQHGKTGEPVDVLRGYWLGPISG